ncbi:sigma-54 dependent transcriptional regulator, partial [bacterium]|nr:sigma-54 dependent transcriptional regulator [bacterium]
MTAAAPTILVVDDEASLRRLLSFTLARRGFRVALAETGEQAVEMVELDPPDICLLDVMLPGIDGLEVLRRARRLVPDLPVIMMTAFGTVERAVEAMKLGAHDFIAKPFDMDRLDIAVKNALSMGRLSRQVRRLTDELRARAGFRGIVGADAGLAPTVELVRKAVPTDLTVLLLGESGVGKELFARAIHDESPRAGGPFVAINCAALPEALLESELFGHERGAFTGADRRRVGRFEAADGGTLFLDEVAETSPAVQAKLLRALQERRAVPLGGSEARPFDVRVVCASNRDLQGLVREGLFREDLYFRLAAFPVT